MCLAKTQEVPEKWMNGGYGYKVYAKSVSPSGDKQYRPLYFDDRHYEIGGVYTAFAYKIMIGYEDYYWSGFHCFVSLKPAIILYNLERKRLKDGIAIVRVKVSDVLAYGDDFTSAETSKYKCVVSHKIKLIKEIK